MFRLNPSAIGAGSQTLGCYSTHLSSRWKGHESFFILIDILVMPWYFFFLFVFLTKVHLQGTFSRHLPLNFPNTWDFCLYYGLQTVKSSNSPLALQAWQMWVLSVCHYGLHNDLLKAAREQNGCWEATVLDACFIFTSYKQLWWNYDGTLMPSLCCERAKTVHNGSFVCLCVMMYVNLRSAICSTGRPR